MFSRGSAGNLGQRRDALLLLENKKEPQLAEDYSGKSRLQEQLPQGRGRAAPCPGRPGDPRLRKHRWSLRGKAGPGAVSGPAEKMPKCLGTCLRVQEGTARATQEDRCKLRDLGRTGSQELQKSQEDPAWAIQLVQPLRGQLPQLFPLTLHPCPTPSFPLLPFNNLQRYLASGRGEEERKVSNAGPCRRAHLQLGETRNPGRFGV